MKENGKKEKRFLFSTRLEKITLTYSGVADRFLKPTRVLLNSVLNAWKSRVKTVVTRGIRVKNDPFKTTFLRVWKESDICILKLTITPRTKISIKFLYLLPFLRYVGSFSPFFTKIFDSNTSVLGTCFGFHQLITTNSTYFFLLNFIQLEIFN